MTPTRVKARLLAVGASRAGSECIERASKARPEVARMG